MRSANYGSTYTTALLCRIEDRAKLNVVVAGLLARNLLEYVFLADDVAARCLRPRTLSVEPRITTRSNPQKTWRSKEVPAP